MLFHLRGNNTMSVLLINNKQVSNKTVTGVNYVPNVQLKCSFIYFTNFKGLINLFPQQAIKIDVINFTCSDSLINI